jgi:hypothetical protein
VPIVLVILASTAILLYLADVVTYWILSLQYARNKSEERLTVIN